MTPRFKSLLIIGIITYVALSLYHWQLAGKFTAGPEATNSSPVLKRAHQEKNWVQVSTTPSQAVTSEGEAGQDEATGQDPALQKEQLHNRTNQPEESDRPDERHTEVVPESELKLIRRQNEELRQALRDERSRRSGETKELRSRLAELQVELAETGKQLREKETQSPQSRQPAKQNRPGKHDDAEALQSLLAARLEALDKANERIRGLADLLDKTREELVEIRNENALLHRQLAAAEAARDEGGEEADRLEGDLDRTIAELERSLAESGRLQSELKEKNTRLNRLENELRNAQQKSDAYYQYSREQTGLIDPFRQRIEMLRARLGDTNSELLGAEDRIEQLNNETEQLRQELQTLRLEKEKNRVIGQELEKTAAALAEEQQTSVQLRTQLKYLALELSRKETALEQMEKELADTTENMQQTGQQYGDLQEQARQYQMQLTKAGSRIKELQHRIEGEATEKQVTEQHLREIQAQNHTLQGRVNELEPKLAEAAARTEKLAAQLQEKDSRLTETMQALEAAQTSLQELQAADMSGEQAEDALPRATEKIAAMQASLAEAETRRQELQETIALSEQKHQADTAKYAALQEEMAQLRQNVADTEAVLADREKTISLLQSENRQMQARQQELDAKKTDSETLQAELERRNRELASQKDQLASLESRLQDLESKLTVRENALTALRQDHAELEDKLARVEAERESLLVYRRDSDNDSVSDAYDACPDTQPGVAVGNDGCEPDQDEDGIADRLDLCPDSSEQADLSPFGCPADAPIILADLYFSSGTADLSPPARSYLDRVAVILQRSPETDFEVGGHTDSIGEPERNLSVSRQRARSVADYLASRGIDAERLHPVGYGPAHPVADNASPEGRRANRRVELKVMDPAESLPGEEQDKAPSPAVQASATGAEKKDSPAR